MEDKILDLYTPEFQTKLNKFRADCYARTKKISNTPTPQLDGKGEKIVDRRPDGYDYISEAFMRDRLDYYFPGWSWEMNGAPIFLGSEWVVVWGTISIIDESLIAYGLPPLRKFSGTNAVRIKYKSGQIHEPGNIIDVGNDVASANSKAFKIALQRLTHIGDDIYGKRIDEEGMGSIEDIVTHDPTISNFGNWIKSRGLSWGKAFEILGVQEAGEIKSIEEAIKIIKVAQAKEK